MSDSDVEDSDSVFRPSTSSGEIRINSSAVHDEFSKLDILNPKLGKMVKGRKCNTCSKEMMSHSSTNLKNHLKSKHPDIFTKVQG